MTTSTSNATTFPETMDAYPSLQEGDAPEPRAVPAIGREQTGIILTESVGIPVHAVLAPGRRSVTGAVLQVLLNAPRSTVLITFANPATALMARRSSSFEQDLLAFDLVLPDGIGMCLAIKWLHGLPARRVSFDMTSLGPEVFEHARQAGLDIVLVGGAPGVAARARDRIVEHYPGLRVSGVFDGFGDPSTTMRQVIALQPRIIICGMGGMLQEAFLLNAIDGGWRGWGFTCGGFLDQLQARLNYYPRWVDRANLRWAYRIFQEPQRLWRRYLFDYGKFGLLLCFTRSRQ